MSIILGTMSTKGDGFLLFGITVLISNDFGGEFMCKRKRKSSFIPRWFEKNDGGYVMDEAPRTVFGTKRKIHIDFSANDCPSDDENEK